MVYGSNWNVLKWIAMLTQATGECWIWLELHLLAVSVCVCRGMCHNVKVSTIPNGAFIFCNSITSGLCALDLRHSAGTERRRQACIFKRIAKTVMMLNYAHIHCAFEMGNGSSSSVFFRSPGDGGRGGGGGGGGDGAAAFVVLVFLRTKFK